MTARAERLTGDAVRIPTFEELLTLLGRSHDSALFSKTVEGLPREALHPFPSGGRAYLTHRSGGLQFYFGEDAGRWVCQSITMFSGRCEDFAAYPHLIDGKMLLSTSPADVHSVLGKPSKVGGGGPKFMNVIVDYPWDRYDGIGHSLRVEYAERREYVRAAQLMTAKLLAKLGAT